MFIRYISHEIRTPLNTVYLGLRVIRADIINSGGDFEEQERRLDAVKDIADSCEVGQYVFKKATVC